MYKDVRAAVDLCHRDGTLKRMVAEDPKRYGKDNILFYRNIGHIIMFIFNHIIRCVSSVGLIPYVTHKA